MPAKILFISSKSDIAGGENYLLLVLRYLDRSRFHPVVWLPGPGRFKDVLDGMKVETVVMPVNYGGVAPARAWYAFLEDLPGRVRAIADFVRRHNIQIVHTNSNIVLEGALAARLTRVRHVHVVHIEFLEGNPIYRRFRLHRESFAQLIDELSTELVAVSGSVAASLTPPLPAGRVKIIHNGLDLDAFNEAIARADGHLRQELGLPRDEVLVVSAGRMHADKGFDLLIEAAARVLPRTQSVTFLICGGPLDGEVAADLQASAARAGAGTRIRFLGHRTDLKEILVESDVFVLSSRFEGHPFVLLEAMACRCACIATRCGGVAETIEHERSGLVIDIEDVGGLETAVLQLVADPALRERLALGAETRVRSTFAAPVMVEKLQALYEQVLASPQPTTSSVTTDLFLQACTEMGHLGTREVALEARVRQLEQIASLLTDNVFTRSTRAAKHWWRRRKATTPSG